MKHRVQIQACRQSVTVHAGVLATGIMGRILSISESCFVFVDTQ